MFDRPPPRPRTPATHVPRPGATTGGSLAKGSRTVTERLVAPATISSEVTDGAVQRAPAHPEDTPQVRAALETQAKLAGPYWARVSPRIADPALRADAAAMTERLRILDEPAAALAADEYALTQALIAAGGWDTKTLAAIQYLNSTSAAVIQSGDPAEIPPP